MANVRSPDGIVPLGLKEYLLEQTLIKPKEDVRIPWLDMIKKNTDETLYQGIVEPMSKIGYPEIGAGLAAIPSAINEFVLPSEVSAWIPMAGSLKKLPPGVTRLPTSAKRPVKNPDYNKVEADAYKEGNLILRDELNAERRNREYAKAEAAANKQESFGDRLNRVKENLQAKQTPDNVTNLPVKNTPKKVEKDIWEEFQDSDEFNSFIEGNRNKYSHAEYMEELKNYVEQYHSDSPNYEKMLKEIDDTWEWHKKNGSLDDAIGEGFDD